MIHRPRRLRKTNLIRDLVAEVSPDKNKLIMPHFVKEGTSIREAINSMPGIERVSIDNMLRDLEEDLNLGIKYIILFGIPDLKDHAGSEAYNENGIVQKAIRQIRKNFGDEICIITDVCLCEYTDHGHCGIVEHGEILNDPTLVLLSRIALSHAQAGADIVAPSDMMDGRVNSIREMLDSNGYQSTALMAYSAKYCSSFYGPFRDAAGSTPQFGDRRSYQMDIRNIRDAEREVLLDIDEGADIVMVKPALSYMDIIRRVADISPVPVCSYNVSGEYSMVKAASAVGYIDEQRVVTEIITSLFRAGSDMIISYHTRDIFKNKWF
ncbi:MAG TPA: porphobilinogen synthase [Spirochaetota bacterium]|jgi:porphobilinogen synthase|nr:porphobilinogen synthase [Spirochaetota bacterium]HOV09187.1 porphobilinogen synthase [Spirochaetota bacterium]